MDKFMVKHYTADENPTIKGNGFDGLIIGEDREEAEEFIDWINERLDKLNKIEEILNGKKEKKKPVGMYPLEWIERNPVKD